MLRVSLAVRVARIFLLKMSRIRKKDLAEVDRRRCRIDRPRESVANERRKHPTVVDVRVREDHGIETPRVDFQRTPVPIPTRLHAQVEAAVDQNSARIGLYQIS